MSHNVPSKCRSSWGWDVFSGHAGSGSQDSLMTSSTSQHIALLCVFRLMMLYLTCATDPLKMNLWLTALLSRPDYLIQGGYHLLMLRQNFAIMLGGSFTQVSHQQRVQEIHLQKVSCSGWQLKQVPPLSGMCGTGDANVSSTHVHIWEGWWATSRISLGG
jgi:hypothetical protein